MKITTHIIWVGIILLFLQGCKDSELDVSEANQPYCLEGNFKEKLEFEVAMRQPVTEGIHLTGGVETNPDKVINFVSLVGGLISKANFSLGDEVEEGQVLAELRSTELSNLESELTSLESQIKVAKKNLKAVQSMYDDGISSKKDLTEAKSELAIYKSEKQKVTSHLNLFSASSEKGVFQIKAPTSGIVTAKSISAGTQISAEGEPLFTISDLSEVWIMVNIYATNVQNVATGMEVNITTLSYPDVTFKGKINAISQVLDSEAKVLKARIVLENKDLKLKPGMLVDVIALKDKKTKAISVPTHAMVFDDNQNFVVVYKSDCEMEIRKVEIFSRNNGFTFISRGLEENEKIISKNQLLIYEQIKN